MPTVPPFLRYAGLTLIAGVLGWGLWRDGAYGTILLLAFLIPLSYGLYRIGMTDLSDSQKKP